MALDWSKDISFSGLLKKKPKPKAVYPTKTHINLIVSDKKQVELRKSLPVVILVAVVTVAIIKFGIFDFYDRVNQKEAELRNAEQVLTNLEAQLVNFDAVKAEYDTYETTRLVADAETVSAIDALNLVDRYITPVAQVNSIDLNGNDLSLNLSDITLENVGNLVSTLYKQPIVENVNVSTATTNKNDTKDKTTANMIIKLRVAV